MALGKDLDEIQAMPSSRYQIWKAYEQIEPFGELRADLRSGILTAVVVNALGGEAKPGDFLMDFEPETGINAAMDEKVKSAISEYKSEQAKYALMACAAMGGNLREQKNDGR